MTKSSLQKFAALFSFLLIASYGLLMACADYFWGYDYDSSFTPETYVDKSYLPLFFTTQDLFYSVGTDGGFNTRFNDDIVAEWSAYLDGGIKRKNLSYLLLNDSANAGIQSTFMGLQQNKKTTAFPFVMLSDQKVRGFMEFMHYAKVIEKSTTAEFNSWNYDDARKPSLVDSKVIDQVESKYKNTNDPFLKNRYWFQTMKAYFYSTNKQNAVSFFDRTKDVVPKNTLYYRALSYVAGALYSQKNYAQSNYLFSVVFDQCPPLRTTTVYNFQPQDQNDFNASLALAESAHEKAALWALYGYYADEQMAVREIYKIDPTSEHLNFLLTRIVNEEEAKLNNLKFTSAVDYKRQVKAQVDKETLKLVSDIAKEGRTDKPYLWNIAAGYLHVFAGNNDLAIDFLDKGERVGPKSTLATSQLRLLKLISVLHNANAMDAQMESVLLPELTWLYSLQNVDETFRRTYAIGWSKKYISSFYQIQNDKVMAELFLRQEDFFHSTTNTEAMKTFLAKPSKTAWEKLAVNIYDVTLDDITEYQADISAYSGNLDEAIKFMKQSRVGSVTALLGNPFNGRIQDCHDCDHEAPQRVTYTKLSLLEKMKEMKSHVDAGQDVYNNSLLLGNAFYNMSYYGNARTFYFGKIINQYGNYIEPFYQPILLNCDKANAYYKVAFGAATTDEQKAKVTYLMAKCERNAFYTKTYHSKPDFYEADVSFLEWAGFKKLKNEYANTKYYKEVIKECGYFSKYVH